MIRKISASTLVVIIIWTSTWAAAPGWAQESPQQMPNRAVLDRLDRFIGLVEQLQAHVDRSQFDLEDLLEQLDFNSERIIKFVRTEITFQPYQGLLRGAKGTLLARSGNALDQAVLLANLLKSAGYDARIVGGDLSSIQADHLLMSASAPRSYPPPIRDSTEARAVVGLLSKELELSPIMGASFFDPSVPMSGRDQSEIAGIAEVYVDLLEHSLDEGDLKLDSSELQTEIEREAMDYHWVEYRDGSEQWSPVHPAFMESPSWTGSLEPNLYYTDSIPDEMQHRLRIQAFVSQRLGTRSIIHPLMSPWERPAANLNAVPLSYATMPNGFATIDNWSPAALKDAVEQSTLFFPSLNSNFPQGGVAFDLDGNTVPPEAAGSHMAALFQTLGSKLGSGLNALSGMESEPGSTDKDQVHLEEHWIELTLISPGGEETSLNRLLISVGTDETVDKDWLGLTATFTPMTGAIPPSFTLNSVLRDLVMLAPSLKALIQAESESTPTTYPPGQDDWSQEVASSPGLLRELLFTWIVDASGTSFSGADLVYRSEPGIIAQYSHLWLFGGHMGGFDIVSNSRRFLSLSEEGPQYNPPAALRHGVWETVIESRFNRIFEKDIFSTIEAFDGPRGIDQKSAKLLTSVDQIPETEVNSAVTRLLKSDINRGFSLIVPPALLERPADRSSIGWWRVDTETGESLGMIFPGWGGVIPAEYMNTQIAALVKANAVKAFGAWLKCELIWGYLSTYAEMIPLGEAGVNLMDQIAGMPAWIQLILAGIGLTAYGASMLNHVTFIQRCIPVVYRIPGL